MKWQEILFQIDKAYELPSEEAEKQLLELDRLCAEEYGKDSFFYGSMLNELGAFYKGQGRFTEAAGCFRKALGLFEVHTGPDKAACATALNNLAGTLRLAGKTDEAEALFRRCLLLYADTVGTSHVLYAAGLNNLSLVCLDRNELDRALQLQLQAAEILRSLPECRDELAVSLINLGALDQKLGRLEEAESLLNEAILLFETELGTDTPHYHTALNGRGVIRYCAGRFAEAEADFSAAAEMAERLYGPDHYEVRSARDNASVAGQAKEGGK